MYLTEDEARQKWCPKYRIVHSGPTDEDVIDNRPEEFPENDCRCIASQCMAWRWRGGDDKDVSLGYCGAFGKP